MESDPAVRTLVLGGIRSGKSQWAEAELASLVAESAGAGQPVRYLATGATDDDPDWSARIAAHRARRPSHWSTVETVDVPTQLRSEGAMPTLVDDIGGWLTAVMDRRGAWTTGSVAADVADLIDAVGGFSSPLALVSQEVGMTVVPPTAAGRRFADELGGLNQRLAGLCDLVVLVVAGQPLTVKAPSRAEARP
jgi:adenosylcobinamide kinase/adenosylcobinamide-phosphate guanylyltransferase